jgi:ankyrin repeat protein
LLSWAVGKGHEARQEGIDPDSEDTYGQTPLSRAAGKGHEGVVRLLFDEGGEGGGDSDTEDIYGQAPLS